MPELDTTTRLARWRSFVDNDDGPGFMFHINFPLPDEEAQLPPTVRPWPDKVGERIEAAWAAYELMCRKAGLVDDDRVPFLTNVTGTDIFAEAFGCKVHRPEETNPFAQPLVRTAAEADALRTPELSTSSVAYLFDIADELYRRGGPDALMKPVDIQSPMDIVAIIWDKSDLFCAMVENPASVKALADKVRELLVAFFDEWFGRYGTAFVAHYPDYVMHEGITVSVDEVGAVRAAMFGEFFRDELALLSEHFGGLGVHCCADARHQWPGFRGLPGLKVINHNVPPTRDRGEYLPDSVRFYGGGVAQVPVGWSPDGEAESWPEQFPERSRVVFSVPAEDAAQAGAIAERLQQIREDQRGRN